MPKGYAEGPAAEEAERRREEAARGGGPPARAADRLAVFGSTADDAGQHFLGWADEVDADELFASGRAWGLVTRRVADAAVDDPSRSRHSRATP